ncbi:vesicle transport v-SNARE 13 isoform X3 [Jatropha curcas]|nr:vesicle transport v-SNARE 13 isoform X3 [Jatropha curcas]
MDLEARSFQPNIKAALLAKLREYKTDLNNLKNEVKRITSVNANQAARDDLLESGMADAMTVSANQRGRLLISTERLTQSTERIKESRRTMLETEELGVSILQDLNQQRQALLHAHSTKQEDLDVHFKEDEQEQMDNWLHNRSTCPRHLSDPLFQANSLTILCFYAINSLSILWTRADSFCLTQCLVGGLSFILRLKI